MLVVCFFFFFVFFYCFFFNDTATTEIYTLSLHDALPIFYNQNKILVAHRHYPFGTKLKITNLENGKSVVAPVLDRGPYTMKGGKYNREIDLSLGAAKALGAVEKGVIPVRIEPLG